MIYIYKYLLLFYFLYNIYYINSLLPREKKKGTIYKSSSPVNIFIHVPKTGGESYYLTFKELIGSNKYGPQQGDWYPEGNYGSWHAEGCGFLGGAAHCEFSELEACIEKPYFPTTPKFDIKKERRYITILRDPIKRVISEIFWGRSAKSNPMFDWTRHMLSKSKDLLKGNNLQSNKMLSFIDIHDTIVLYNRYIRMFTQKDSDTIIWKPHNCLIGNKEDSFNYWRSYYNLNSGSTFDIFNKINNDTKLWEEADSTLNYRMFFTGIFEEPELTIALFCKINNIDDYTCHQSIKSMHSKSCGKGKPLHKGTPKVNFPDSINNLLKEKNKGDIWLYNRALDHFYEQVKYYNIDKSNLPKKGC